MLDHLNKEYTAERVKGKLAWNQMDEEALKPQSKAEFLAKLPKQVIRNGKIVNIRDEVEREYMKGGGGNKRSKIREKIEQIKMNLIEDENGNLIIANASYDEVQKA